MRVGGEGDLNRICNYLDYSQTILTHLPIQTCLYIVPCLTSHRIQTNLNISDPALNMFVGFGKVANLVPKAFIIDTFDDKALNHYYININNWDKANGI